VTHPDSVGFRPSFSVWNPGTNTWSSVIDAVGVVFRCTNLLEQILDTWDDGYGVVQIVAPEETDDTQLRFCYDKGGELVNGLLTIAPTQELDFGNPVVGVGECLGVFGQQCDDEEVAVAGEVIDEVADAVRIDGLQGVD